MKLIPIRPPGNARRKARVFAAEILQLRSQGYTFEAIREALALAGIRVSNSTVQREASLSLASLVPDMPGVGGHQPDGLYLESPSKTDPIPCMTAPSSSLSADPRTGKEIAEDFVRNRICNPLIRSEGSR